MKYRLPFVLIPCSVILLTGCSLYQVGVHKPASPSGIPFFAAEGACTQETAYANPYYLLTLKFTGSSGLLFSDSVKLSKAGYSSDDFKALVAELSKPQPDTGSVQKAWNLLKQENPFDPHTETGDQFLLKNTRKAIAIVDYANHYSLNQRRPLAGSASADFKLNSDGTLSEAQAQVQDDTLTTILGTLPLSDLIKSAAGITSKTGNAEAQVAEPVKFSLEQEERLWVTTYSETTDYKANCPVGAALTEKAGVGVAKMDIGAKDLGVKTEGDKKSDDSSIGVSGTISLPKSLLPQMKKDDGGAAGKASSAAGGDSSGGAKTNPENKTGGKTESKKDKKPGGKGPK